MNNMWITCELRHVNLANIFFLRDFAPRFKGDDFVTTLTRSTVVYTNENNREASIKFLNKTLDFFKFWWNRNKK